MARWNWANQSVWRNLGEREKVTLMGLMEADGNDPEAAMNAVAAIINRANKAGQSYGDHVSNYRLYQPLIEPAQLNRVNRLMKDPNFQTVAQYYDDRISGKAPDRVKGATHYLSKPATMEALYRRQPDKYHNWGPFKNSRGVPGRNWTGYNPQTKQYANQTITDGSHAFLAPEGAHSADFGYSEQPNVAQNGGSTSPLGLPQGARGYQPGVPEASQGYSKAMMANAGRESNSLAMGFLPPEPGAQIMKRADLVPGAQPGPAEQARPGITGYGYNPMGPQGGSAAMRANWGRDMAPMTPEPSVATPEPSVAAPAPDMSGVVAQAPDMSIPDLPGGDFLGGGIDLSGIFAGLTPKAPAPPSLSINAAPVGGGGKGFDVSGLVALLKKRTKFGA